MLRKKSRLIAIVLSLAVLGASPSSLRGQEIPAGTILEIILREPISSYAARRGAAVHAVLVAAVQQDGRTLLPAGAEVEGSVVSVKRVGLGVLRERAQLLLRFDHVTPGGSPLAMESRVVEVENAREKLRADGTIVGIRATDSYGHQMTGMASTAAAVDPLLLIFAFAGASSVMRFPEAEIAYPAGTELHLKLLQPLRVPQLAADSPPPVATTGFERQSLSLYVNELPNRTRTKHKNIPSDLTNLVFLGTREQLLQAFAAAGWTRAAGMDPNTKYETVRALAENRGYADAPVSILLLAGQPPALVFEKALNTINKRHHLRIWQITNKWNGQTAWTSAATHDIGIGISGKKTVIHKIDTEIDRERAKVVNDLLFAGCADGVELVDRPQAPRVSSNATGDRITTDGRAAVLRLKDCGELATRDAARKKNAGSKTSNPVLRGVRQFDLTLRNSLLRDNVAWQAYKGSRLVWKMAHHHSAAPPATVAALLPEPAPDVASAPHLAVAEDFGMAKAIYEGPRSSLPEVAFSLTGGQFQRMRLGNMYLAWQDPVTGEVGVYQFRMRIEPGVVLGTSVTLNPSRFLSHEMHFTTLQANLLTGEDPDVQVGRLLIRSTGYQVEANLAPRRWRVRPFITAGTDLTTYHFKNIKLTKKNGVFKFGLKNVGAAVGAFNSAKAAPLDGGTVFRLGLTCGGGVKFRVSRLLQFQAEYRATYAKDPGFFNKQAVSMTSQGITTAQDPASRAHGVALLGLSFTP